MDEQTKYLYSSSKAEDSSSSRSANVQPHLFISCDREITGFALSGRQSFGRPSENNIPDILINNKYVSRKHGVFQTSGGTVTYTAGLTTNPTIFNRRILSPGETVTLYDGNELTISSGDKENDYDIILVCALSESRIAIWRELVTASLDSLTGLPKRNAFLVWYMQRLNHLPDDKNCVFVLEIDFFDKLVANYGREAADNAVKYVSEQLGSVLDNRGILCRWDENKWVGTIAASSRGTYFVMEDFGNDIRKTLIDGAFHITLSISYLDISKFPEKKHKLEELIMLTDDALQEAKRSNGRDCLCEYRA